MTKRKIVRTLLENWLSGPEIAMRLKDHCRRGMKALVYPEILVSLERVRLEKISKIFVEKSTGLIYTGSNFD